MMDIAALAFSAASMKLLFCSVESGDESGGRGGGGGNGPPSGPPAAAFTIAKRGDVLKSSAAVWGSSIPGCGRGGPPPGWNSPMAPIMPPSPADIIGGGGNPG